MPFGCGNPWRDQFFGHIKCSAEVFVPLKDDQAWIQFPKYQKVYDKLFVAKSQGLAAAPHGVIPPTFPVFSKPITNLQSMGQGSLRIDNLEAYEKNLHPGHFWSTYLTGEHISTDVAIVNGVVKWWRHTTAIPQDLGTFDYFRVEAKQRPMVEKWITTWTQEYLEGYTGMANFETISGRIIEVHLRFSDQWPDLYGGDRWLNAVVNLYTNQIWEFDESEEDEDGFSVILFGLHGSTYVHPSETVVQEVLGIDGVSSVQISFHNSAKQLSQSNPPGGCRLAIVNSRTLESGQKAREILRRSIKSKNYNNDQSML